MTTARWPRLPPPLRGPEIDKTHPDADDPLFGQTRLVAQADVVAGNEQLIQLPSLSYNRLPTNGMLVPLLTWKETRERLLRGQDSPNTILIRRGTSHLCGYLLQIERRDFDHERSNCG